MDNQSLQHNHSVATTLIDSLAETLGKIGPIPDVHKTETTVEKQLGVHDGLEIDLLKSGWNSKSYNAKLHHEAEQAWKLRRWALAAGVDARQFVPESNVFSSRAVAEYGALWRDLFAPVIPDLEVSGASIQDLKIWIGAGLQRLAEKYRVDEATIQGLREKGSIAYKLAAMRGDDYLQYWSSIQYQLDTGLQNLGPTLHNIQNELLRVSIEKLSQSLATCYDDGEYESSPSGIASGAIYDAPLRPNEIRILTLLPKDETSTLVNCTLHTEQLSDALPYTALSYVWGRGAAASAIQVDDRWMYVRRPLQKALATFQEDEPLRLWIDAISINQTDETEKQGQLKLMSTIYASAEKVWIWLEDDESIAKKEADATIQQQDESAMAFIRHISPADFEKYPSHDVPKIWNYTRALLDRKWWQRFWIIQEASLARKAFVRVGTAMVEFERFVDLKRLWRHFYVKDLYGQEPKRLSHLRLFNDHPASRWLEHFSSMRATSNTLAHPHIQALLENHEDANSFLRSDRVYGLLSLADKYAQAFLSPLHKSSVQRLYTRATILSLVQIPSWKTTNCLYLLQRAMATKAVKNLSSWVIDWSSPDDAAGLSTPPEYYRADAGHVSLDRFGRAGHAWQRPHTFASHLLALHLSAEHQLLGLRGIYVDTVAWVGVRDDAPSPDPKSDCYGMDEEDQSRVRVHRRKRHERWKAWKHHVEQQHDHVYGDDTGRWEAFWRTIHANVTSPHNPQPPSESYGEEVRLWLELEAIEQHDGQELQPPSDILFNAAVWQTGRNFLVTSRGYFGLASSKVRLDDAVYVVFGSSVPFVVRSERNGKSSENEARFRLVSPAYVHGVMRGEAIERASNNNAREIWLS